MGFLNVNLASTPCCGLISRSKEWVVDSSHEDGGYYLGEEGVEEAGESLDKGICPDCGCSFVTWLHQNGGRQTSSGWRWNYQAAQREYQLRAALEKA